MKATSIPAHENSFHTTGVDSANKKFILTYGDYKIKGSSETVHLVDCAPQNGNSDYYYKEETPKKKIVIHFTMGYLKGDIATLTKGHVSVPFVLARSGNVYNIFSSKYWSYHLGKSASGGNTAMSQQCIGIEISNIGPLKLIGNNLVTTYNDTDIYCTLSDSSLYTKLPKKYRGFEYYATFTNAQYDALIKLIRFLCAKYSIPMNFIEENKRYETLTDQEFTAFNGIVSHVNCRKDKCDIGPAFDWNRIVLGTQV